jgi:RNA polymerase sigma-70 factor (ECF subfamily)
VGVANTLALPPVARAWWPAGRAAGRPRAAGERAAAAAAEVADAAGDAALVRQAATGDRDAFGLLVRRHLPAAHAAALAVLGEAADAEDCCQDAFVAALTRLEECRPAEKFRGWLLTIVRNRAIDLQRRQRVRRADVLDVGAGAPATGASDRGEPTTVSPASRAPDPLADAERADARGHLRRALAALTPTRREVVLLHDLEGWTHRDIAAHLGVAEGTVRAHLFWARRALRERLSADLRPPTGRRDHTEDHGR